MSQYRIVRNERTNEVVLQRAKWCSSFLCHLRGLQFVRQLPPDEGLLFVTKGESVTGTAIHMFFMFINIGVVWLDADGMVVDKKYAKVWRPAYAPARPARFYIEANPEILERVEIGDALNFDEVTT